ncbi:hypothetical protein C8J57DRAFT_1708934 [Mycena rebaudengoi]|nr:hypothetical protein C8J57DRAFT_1708934 [Mycena rebaudengoi]
MPRTALTASVLSPTEDGGGVPADHEGIDILCEAILTGMRVWILDKAATDFTGESWYNSLLEFIQLLRQLRSEDLLPKAWNISQDLRTIIPTPYRLQEVDVLVDPKPCDPGPGTVPSFDPQPENRRTGLQRAFRALSNYFGAHAASVESSTNTSDTSSTLSSESVSSSSVHGTTGIGGLARLTLRQLSSSIRNPAVSAESPCTLTTATVDTVYVTDKQDPDITPIRPFGSVTLSTAASSVHSLAMVDDPQTHSVVPQSSRPPSTFDVDPIQTISI